MFLHYAAGYLAGFLTISLVVGPAYRARLRDIERLSGDVSKARRNEQLTAGLLDGTQRANERLHKSEAKLLRMLYDGDDTKGAT